MVAEEAEVEASSLKENTSHLQSYHQNEVLEQLLPALVANRSNSRPFNFCPICNESGQRAYTSH